MTAPPERRNRLISMRRRTGRPPGKARRRIGVAVRLVAALTLVGGLYTAFAPGMRAVADDSDLSARALEGKRLYETSCISCHGSNAQGVQDRGPSLIGVGSAAVEFQVTTGRMPLPKQDAQAVRRPPVLTPEQADLIGQYIQEIGGGPQMPAGDDLHSDGDLSRGGELFRINCSSCHAFSANGGALSSGKSAPGMQHATDRDFYAAMLTGPSNMPVFGDNQLTPQEKRDIIAYVQNLKSDQDPGGWGLGRYGPVPEGLAIFLIGMVAIVITTLWIAGKS